LQVTNSIRQENRGLRTGAQNIGALYGVLIFSVAAAIGGGDLGWRSHRPESIK
jgi:hypothetical protein